MILSKKLDSDLLVFFQESSGITMKKDSYHKKVWPCFPRLVVLCMTSQGLN